MDLSMVYLTTRPGGIDLLGVSLVGGMPRLNNLCPEFEERYKSFTLSWGGK